MTKSKQSEHFEKLVDRMRKTLLSKGDDYAGADENCDRLINFKGPGMVTGTLPAIVCLDQLSIKISRLAQLLKSQSKPNNESIADNSLDMVCYAILADMLITGDK